MKLVFNTIFATFSAQFKGLIWHCADIESLAAVSGVEVLDRAECIGEGMRW